MEIKPYLHTTQYYETDGMGIIHHANYIYWMEEARTDFMEQIGFGYDKSVESGIDFALTSISCQYKAMTRFRETVHIYVYVQKITPVRITVGYRMMGQDGIVRCEGESCHCYFSAVKKRPVALSKELPQLYDRLRAFCEDC